jgi:aspartate 1-decarboxylase
VELSLLKSRIQGACVTGADANSEGSVTISADLAELVGLEEYERVLVSNLANGERFETYVIYGIRNAGAIQLNGATAHLGKPGDRLTIMSFGLYDAEEAAIHQPKVIFLDEKNLVTKQH